MWGSWITLNNFLSIADNSLKEVNVVQQRSPWTTASAIDSILKGKGDIVAPWMTRIKNRRDCRSSQLKGHQKLAVQPRHKWVSCRGEPRIQLYRSLQMINKMQIKRGIHRSLHDDELNDYHCIICTRLAITEIIMFINQSCNFSSQQSARKLQLNVINHLHEQRKELINQST